jgi:hypothetical protein
MQKNQNLRRFRRRFACTASFFCQTMQMKPKNLDAREAAFDFKVCIAS